MPETFVSKVSLEDNVLPMKFVAVNGERIRDMTEKAIPFTTSEGILRSINFRSANEVKSEISTRQVVHGDNVDVLEEGNLYIRNTRDGATLKLYVNSGV